MKTQDQVVGVVDDDPAMLKGIERLLNAYGYETKVFSSAEAFLDCTDVGALACLILDIHLRGISGLELRRHLVAAGSRLPVIFITAVDDEATQQQAMEAGCVAYLRKPFLASLLIGAIGKADG